MTPLAHPAPTLATPDPAALERVPCCQACGAGGDEVQLELLPQGPACPQNGYAEPESWHCVAGQGCLAPEPRPLRGPGRLTIPQAIEAAERYRRGAVEANPCPF